jgi:hypothetical protein
MNHRRRFQNTATPAYVGNCINGKFEILHCMPKNMRNQLGRLGRNTPYQYQETNLINK